MRKDSTHTDPRAEERDGPAGDTATKLVQVRPLRYTQLRLLAECTAGLEEEVNFVVTREGILEITKEDGFLAIPDTAHDVVVPARASGKYPHNEVWLQVRCPDKQLVLKPGFADAVFWSDSSVHKFVVPYVASCAGDDAPRVLSLLQDAWNLYPTDRVTVYALVHSVQHVPGTPLALENRLYVAFTPRLDHGGTGPLELDSLATFLDRYPPQKFVADPATPPLVAYHRGKGGHRQHPDYATLRALAEHAASISDVPKYFVFKAGGHGFLGNTPIELPAVEPGDVVIPAYTPTVPPHRPRLHGVWCHGLHWRAINLAAIGDAVFWSNGAIEQFLYPYYASKGGIKDGLRELLEISEMWLGDQSAGAERGPEPRAQDAATVAGEEEDLAFITGLVHMPTSEWIPDEETPAPDPFPRLDASGSHHEEISRLSPRRQVGVLYHQNGETHVMPAGRFIEGHRRR